MWGQGLGPRSPRAPSLCRRVTSGTSLHLSEPLKEAAGAGKVCGCPTQAGLAGRLRCQPCRAWAQQVVG